MSKRILFLAPAPPSNRHGGGALRMLYLVRFLSKHFEVDLVSPDLDGRQEAEQLLRHCCTDMEFVPIENPSLFSRVARIGPYHKDPALSQVIIQRLATGKYQAVQVEKPAMLPYVPSGLTIPIILDCWAYGLIGSWRALKYECGMLTRARNLLRLARFSWFDTFSWPQINRLLVVSEEDQHRCARERPTQRTEVVPNGVDCTLVTCKPSYEAITPVLIFTGDMSFEPNIDAALLLAHEIFPRVRKVYPEAELRLVGRLPDARVRALVGNGIVVTGGVPDMLPHLHGATLYVAPHFTGAGTRTKLLEAMAAGLPIITTTIGIEGIRAQPGQDVLIADTSTDTVEAVLTLLTNIEVRRRFGLAARRLAETRYDWDHCLLPLEGVYRNSISTEVAA